MSRYSSTVLGMGPVGYWRLGEPSGTVATDQTGNQNGAYVASPTLGASGALASDPDTAVTLNGSSQYVSVNDVAGQHVGNVFSLLIWVKTSGNGQLFYGNTNSYSMDITAGSVRIVQDSVAVIATSTVTVNDNAWHLVAWSRAGNGADKLYIDGVDRTGTVTSVGPIANSNTIKIGSTSFSGYITGSLDEVALFNRALSFAENSLLYTAATALAPPNLAATLGGTDISADLFGLTWDRGANFDGTSESPGTAVLTVANIAAKYNPANGASPIASVLRLGTEVRATAAYGAAGSVTTYGLYHGFLRRTVPIPGQTINYQTAEIHCEDALWKLGRAEVNIGVSTTTAVNAMRAAILTAVGEASNRRNLSLSGPEADNPVTYVDHGNALTVLTDLNKATGSLHFVKPDPTTAIGYKYTTIDRASLEVSTSAETFDDTDLSKPFGNYLGGHDHTDEGVINSQRVVPHPRYLQPVQSVWDLGSYPFNVAASTNIDLWPNWTDPTLNLAVVYVATNSPTVTLTVYGSSAKINIAAGGSTAVFSSLYLTGQPLSQLSTAQTTISADAASQAPPPSGYGLMRGNDIDSQFIPSVAHAQGLGDYVVWRYKTPRSKPVFSVENRFPTILARDIGDRITLKSTVLSITSNDYFIRAIAGVVSDSGNRWTMTYTLEEAPATLNLFTVGGDAAHGVGGGSQILGY